MCVCVCVQDQRSATKDNVERRLARTAQELAEEEESSESEAAEESEEEDDDGVPYNPKNLPLGWDGKVCMCMCSLSLLVTSPPTHSLFLTGCTSCMA